MSEQGDGDGRRRAKPSHSWSHISSGYGEEGEAARRRELKEYMIPISVLQLDPADRKVLRIAGKNAYAIVVLKVTC